MARELVLWNGRTYGLLPTEKWGRQPHFYAAAYSRADLRRLMVELGLRDPGDLEIKRFWTKGVWGNHMAGITPERGIWVQEGWVGTPVRLYKDEVQAEAGVAV